MKPTCWKRFQPGYSNDHSSDLEARIFLRKEVKRLKEENARLKGEVHDWSSSCKELAKDLRRQEKVVNWLAKQANLLCNKRFCDLCRAYCPDGDGENAWIEAANKAAEKQ